MKILLLPDNSDAEGVTVDVARIPMAGEFITINNNGVEIWHRVQLVALMPMGEIAAKVLTVWMAKAEAKEYAGRHEPEPSWKRQYELLTEAEAAAIAKVHPRTIRRLIDTGRLTAINLGFGKKKLYRINPENLEAIADYAKASGPQHRRRRQLVVATSEAPWPPRPLPSSAKDKKKHMGR